MSKRTQSLDKGKLQTLAGPKARAVLTALGQNELPDGNNPVWLALAGLNPPTERDITRAIDAGELSSQEAQQMRAAAEKGKALAAKLPLWRGSSANKTAILTAYTVCQVHFLAGVGGPLADESLGTIRQGWYFSKDPNGMGFKFASQLLEREIIKSADFVLVDDERARDKALAWGAVGEIYFKTDWKSAKKRAIAQFKDDYSCTPRIATWPKSGWGRSYAQAQSQILTDLVRGGATYNAMYVEDASRPTEIAIPLLRDFHFVLLLEKEGLVPHFKGFCERAGIKVLVGAAGNMAFSAIEQILNANFMHQWGYQKGKYIPTEDNPLHLLSLTDHDYFGHIPVQDGALRQFERYLPDAVKLHRVGITPEQVRELGRSVVQAGYEFDAEYNASTSDWADVQGVWVGDTCYALEVEALTPAEYVPTIIDTIVEIVGGDEELRRLLAAAAEPDQWTVQDQLKQELFEADPYWSALDAFIARVNAKKWNIEVGIVETLTLWLGDERDEWSWWNQARSRIADVIEEETAHIGAKDLCEHVLHGRGLYAPVSSEAATGAMLELAKEDFADDIEAMVEASRFDHEKAIENIQEAKRVLGIVDLD